MEPKLQLRVQRYGWDAAAPHYHNDWADQLRPAQDTLLEMAGLQAGMSILETACGTGMVTMRAAQVVGDSGAVFATDLSGEMISQITDKCAEAGLTNVSFARMGAEALDGANDSYDMAFCALGLMYVPDPRKALAEMARVVRPSGKVVATIWGERRRCGWADIFPIVDAQVASDVCPLFFASGAPGILKMDFESANLTDLHEIRQTEMLEFKTADALTRAIMLGGPVAMAVKRFDANVMAQVTEEFLASVAQYLRADGGYSIPGEFVTVCATVSE